MDSRRLVLRETGFVAAGVLMCSAVMVAVFALLGRYDGTVLAGGIVGALLAILNFFFMAMNATVAADRAVNQDVKGGKSLVQISYALRMVVIFVVLFACVKSGVCNALAGVLPLAFVRPVLTVAEFFGKKGDDRA